MKILTPSVFALLSIFTFGTLIPSEVNAEPLSNASSIHKKHMIKKRVVHRKKYKKHINTQPSVAELKTQCYTNYSMTNEISPAAFFACDNIGIPSSTFEPRAKKTEHSIFGNSSNPTIINEASKLAGLDARSHREEIKTYLKSGNSNQTPVDPLKTPWCAAFANAVLRRTGYEGTDSLMARSFLSWGIKTKNPKEGDIVVLRRGKGKILGHVGFFDGYEWDGNQLYVKILGGNQGKSVNVAYFPVNYVLAYRRPV